MEITAPEVPVGQAAVAAAKATLVMVTLRQATAAEAEALILPAVTRREATAAPVSL